MSGASDGRSDSYYGQPVIKEPVWKPAVPIYFFTGGLAGASAGLAFVAQVTGRRVLARNATLIGMLGMVVSPILLIVDLGRPSRFQHMLRMAKLTSPMSVGTWLLTGLGATLGLAAGCRLFGILRPVGLVAGALAAALGLPVATYTAALIADTAVPAWHEARGTLPFVFAGGSAASAGAAAMLITAPKDAQPARRLALAGAVLESAAAITMEQRLGPLLGEPYRQGRAGRATRFAHLCLAAGAAVVWLAGTRRSGARIGAALLLTAAMAERWGVFLAGGQSARDPKYTVVPQRERAHQGARSGDW